MFGVLKKGVFIILVSGDILARVIYVNVIWYMIYIL